MGYNQPCGGWQATQQLYQPQTNSFMPKAQNPAESFVGASPCVFVPSEEDARNRIVQPDQTAWFMDNNNPRFYVKACDISGAVTNELKFAERLFIELEYSNSNMNILTRILRLRHGLPDRDSRQVSQEIQRLTHT